MSEERVPEAFPPPAGDPGAVRGYVLEDQVGHLLRRVHQRATAIFLGHFAASQLTPTQWAALFKLWEQGAISQNHLGRLTAMDPATVQGVVRRLEKRGLAERAEDPRDRRRTVLALTKAGRDMVLAQVEAAFAVTADTLAPLTPSERASLLAILRKLG